MINRLTSKRLRKKILKMLAFPIENAQIGFIMGPVDANYTGLLHYGCNESPLFPINR